MGSPPRMRGKVDFPLCPSPPYGITPAYAGKSELTKWPDCWEWDHPRVCGEKFVSGFWQMHSIGSPPRMRGKVSVQDGSGKRKRITPAYAGKRNRVQPGRYRPQDHPRVCGEKGIAEDEHPQAEGSPPRMRGKDDATLAQNTADRITPAYAGKSYRCSWPGHREQDHPRVCGEKPIALRQNKRARGSPPRMRGKDALGQSIHAGIGITPAYAGKSSRRKAQPFCCRDHPRVCGEKALKHKEELYELGSPPRMRGKVSPGEGRVP